MKHLYAPWRGIYLKDKQPSGSCPFCIQYAPQEDDRKNFIIKRFASCAVMLNLYPYNAGHLLLIPYKHAATLSELTPEIRSEMMEVLEQTTRTLQKTLNNQGTNVGINLGEKAAGGSIPEHLHLHIVPRFQGDTNFLPVIANTKQISRDLNEIYGLLYEAFNNAA